MINREGHRILGFTAAGSAISVGAVVCGLSLIGKPLWPAWIVGGCLLLLVLFVAFFFRDTKRKFHITDDKLVFSAADGKVVVIEEVYEAEYLGCDCIQVSVFMSLFNKHVNWFPVGGTVVYRRDHPGKFMVAWHPKSSEENERMTTVVDTGHEKILFRQIAGMVARRIVNYAHEDEMVEQNTRCGFIKFGSRVDVFLPPGSEILISLGDTVKGGVTPLARLPR